MSSLYVSMYCKKLLTVSKFRYFCVMPNNIKFWLGQIELKVQKSPIIFNKFVHCLDISQVKY